MSDQTHLLERIMGLQVELNHFGECSRQQQIHYDAELSRVRHENRNLQVRLRALQAENNTLQVKLEAGLSVISYLEQRLKFHLKTLLEQEPPRR
jgi:ABC-type phosphate transport system auxiliary subunit